MSQLPATAAEIATLEPAARAELSDSQLAGIVARAQTVGHGAVVDEAIHAMRSAAQRTAVEADAD